MLQPPFYCHYCCSRPYIGDITMDEQNSIGEYIVGMIITIFIFALIIHGYDAYWLV